jgi:uncharacterized membrane protein YcaP (DUF421 family)
METTVLMRTLFVYFFLLIIFRLMGKREIGKVSVFDLVVSIMIAEFASLAIEDPKKPLISTIIPIAVVALTQIILSYLSLKFTKLRHLVDGRPTIIVRNGEIQDKAMSKHRYNMDDLLQQLRDRNITKLADVEFAILEPSGKLSVIPKKNKMPVVREDLEIDPPYEGVPVPLIVDGKIRDNHLDLIGKNRFWLKNQIQNHGYRDFKEIFYAEIDQNGKMYIDPKD